MSGSQGHGNRKQDPQRCQEDHKRPHREKNSAHRVPRTRWHTAEKQEH
jgi:hypothetical protein